MNQIVYAGKHLLTFNVNRHSHGNWEFIYCTGGSGTLSFEDKTVVYGPGDVAVIPPGVPHRNNSQEGFTNIHLNVTDPTLNLKSPAIVRDDTRHSMLSAFEGAFYHFSMAPGQQTPLLIAYGNLVVAYLAAYQDTLAYSPVVAEIENTLLQSYPDSSFELDSYLRSFPFSYDYLRKLFKKEVGVTPHQYLTDKRLQTAAESLCSPFSDGSNVSEIAHICGFREPLYFSRVFKSRYGVSPSQYQKEHAGGGAGFSEPFDLGVTE